MAKKKCVICGEYIEEGQETVPFKNRTAHITCFNLAMKITTNTKKKTLSESKATNSKAKTPKAKKPPAELKDGISEEEYRIKMDFFNTLRDVSRLEKLEARTYKVVEDYMKKYGFTYESMKLAIEYFYIIKSNTPQGDCIGIIPYVHDEAISFYKGLENVERLNKDITAKEVKEYYQTKRVKITPKQSLKRPLIDISKIGE